MFFDVQKILRWPALVGGMTTIPVCYSSWSNTYNRYMYIHFTFIHLFI